MSFDEFDEELEYGEEEAHSVSSILFLQLDQVKRSKS